MEAIAFYVLASLALLSGLFVILGRNAVVCGLALTFNLMTIAGFFFLLRAQFIGFLQVIVYAGAIMVLIVFVLMLLNIQDEERMRAPRFFQKWLTPLLALVFVVMLLSMIQATAGGSAFPARSADFGTVKSVGQELFTRFFYPFEAISILLVVAMISAVLLAKKRL